MALPTTVQPTPCCPGTDSGRPLAPVQGKAAEVTLKRRRAELELQKEKGSKGQVAPGRRGRHPVGRKEHTFAIHADLGQTLAQAPTPPQLRHKASYTIFLELQFFISKMGK